MEPMKTGPRLARAPQQHCNMDMIRHTPVHVGKRHQVKVAQSARAYMCQISERTGKATRTGGDVP
jgi:hypothetical protein